MEVIIAKEKDSLYSLASGAIFVSAVLIIILLFKFAGVVAFVPAPFILFAGGLFARLIYINNNKVEFEYSYSTGILNIDKIINQAKRVHVIRIAMNDILTFGKYSYDDEEINKKDNFQKQIDCGSGREDNLYYFTCNYANKGLYMIIIEGDSKLISLMKGSSTIVNRSLMNI